MKLSKIITVFSAAIVAISMAVLAFWAKPTLAAKVDVWGDQYTQGGITYNSLAAIGLGNKDPRVIVTNVISVLLGFLGLIALVLIMYGGWMWMNAKGNEQQIEKAKLLLRNAVIGLLIILSAFAISIYITYVLQKATGANVGNYNGDLGCVDGETKVCGCHGLQTCINKTWSLCAGSDCGGGDGQFCDSNTLTPTCEADNSICKTGQHCDASTCRCTSGGGYGDPCNGSNDVTKCEPDNNKCGQYLTCDKDSCTCKGGPVIEAVTPQGGYCDGSSATPCLSDADCTGLKPATCNKISPNGAEGNLLTIHGRYFRDFKDGVSKVYLQGTSGFVEAPLAETLNPDCTGDWSDSRIIVSVPQGAQTGAVKVVAENGEDVSSSGAGPKLQDVKINSMVRPGLCRLSKEDGIFGDKVEYKGVNLNGSTGFFGNLVQGVQANDSIFTDKLSGSVTVPNFEARETSTYVLQTNKAASNFLSFNKLADAQSGPTITEIDPRSGPAGQYVTIRGSGFGEFRNDSHVNFASNEADYNFPPVCADSIWRDNEIVVKVPKGLADSDVKISVQVGEQTAKSNDSFKVDSKEKLKPGLCRIKPLLAKPGESVSLWGEYFGNKSNDNKVLFNGAERKGSVKICYGGKDDGKECSAKSDCESNKCESEISYWDKDNESSKGVKIDKVTTKVALSANTGAVKIYVNESQKESNGLNLTVGQCSNDLQCGAGNVCCPAGAPLEGSCQDKMDKCYGASDSCVFEWEFSTGTDNSCPITKPNACQDGNCCKSACVYDDSKKITVCMDDESCAGLSANQCLDSVTCPNSPGKCSNDKNAEIKGASCDCQMLGYTGSDYDSGLNRCVKSGSSCSLPRQTPDINGNKVDTYCAMYQGQPRWHLESALTCPDDFTKVAGNNSLCVNINETCDLCQDNFTCIEKDGSGVCASKINTCPNGFECKLGSCTRQSGSCECCCDKTQNKTDGTNPACCAPLTCANSCGTGGNFGSCSGCANVGETQADHDNACNCTGTTGKYCDTSVAGGVCRDCGQIGDLADCSSHSSCCVDFKKGNACTGIKDGIVEENNLNFCAYFDCGDGCKAGGKDKPYSTQEKCNGTCEPTCDSSDQPGCQADNNACPADKPVCNSECKCEAISCDSSDLPGCQANANMCPANQPVCNNECKCEAAGDKPGSPCQSPQGSCSLFCGNIYTCRGEQGCVGLDCIGQPDESTCRCCCDPNKKSDNPNASDFDKCKAVGKTAKLSCKANEGDCSGNERGLCCGCSKDEECGALNEAGCGTDACCHSRPIVEKMIPGNNASGVCRNAAIRVEFSGKMDEASLKANMILVGDYLDEQCPEGTNLLAMSKPASSNWLVRAWQSLVAWISRVTGLGGTEVNAASGHNFCAVEGDVSSLSILNNNKTKTAVYFTIASPLEEGIKYYAIIKGDERLDSKTGVLSIDKVGMKGSNLSDIGKFNGYVYANAQIWSFTAGADICTLDKVEVDPAQHLYQKPNEKYTFAARAYDQNDIEIVPTTLYNWSWQWSIDDAAVATLSASNSLTTDITSNNKADAYTFARAKATITSDTVSSASTVGEIKEGKARIIVFLCSNPWPVVTNVNAWPMRYNDSATNCTICSDPVTNKPRPCAPGDCLNNDFTLYYCRDKGTGGTSDDLPSLDKNSPVRGRYKNFSGNQKWDEILKDYFFFRSALPTAPTNVKVELGTGQMGGEVVVSWSAQADTKYKVYYGGSTKQYNYSQDGGNGTATIKKLTNGKTYYFAVSAVNSDGVESKYSEEVKVEVGDNQAPAKPVELKASINATLKKVNLEWKKESEPDINNYILEYGPNLKPAISLNIGIKNSYSVSNLDNISAQDYWLHLRAVDKYGNKSEEAVLKCSKGCSSSSCACVLQ